MADKTTFDGLMNLISNRDTRTQEFYTDSTTSVTAFTSAMFTQVRSIPTKDLPALPGGITKYRLFNAIAYAAGNGELLICKKISLGTLDISGASGTFTDGSTMPSRTELGNSVTTYGPLFIEVTTVLNATPGTLAVTYTDQSGNTGHTITGITLPASGPVQTGCIAELASGDYGVQDITAASRGAGTTPTGTLTFWGLLPLGSITMSNAVGIGTASANITNRFNIMDLGGSDKIAVLHLTNTAGQAMMGSIWFMGEV